LPDVVRCETIMSRSARLDWVVAVHRHARLHQVLLVEPHHLQALDCVRQRPRAVDQPDASEPGDALGFDDPAYFSRVYVAATGLPPREFYESVHGATDAPQIQRLPTQPLHGV
jgi:AraC-like DNA-binding protein